MDRPCAYGTYRWGICAGIICSPSIVLNEKRGYSRHPEVLRWRGKLKALWMRHEEQRIEMVRRGYSHRSPLYLRDVPRRHRDGVQRVLLEPVETQWRKLRMKGCECSIHKTSRKSKA